MKYLFWLAVILFVWWTYQRSRASGAARSAGTPPSPKATPQVQEMVTCAHCGIHLPHDEAVAGTRGAYCSTAHRQAAGDRNPG